MRSSAAADGDGWVVVARVSQRFATCAYSFDLFCVVAQFVSDSDSDVAAAALYLV